MRLLLIAAIVCIVIAIIAIIATAQASATALGVSWTTWLCASILGWLADVAFGDRVTV